MSYAFDNLVVSIDEGVATIMLNRAEVRNAIDLKTWQEIDRVISLLDADDAVQILIFTGAGDEAFAAGTDIRWLRDRDMFETLEAYSQSVLQKLEDLPKPSIAAVNGYALGGGCELALACDIRYASEKAQFGQPEVRLSIVPGAGGTQRLPRAVGIARAKELIFSGEMIDAYEAERIGLVNRIVPPSELMDTCLQFARKVMQRGPVAVRLAKLSINAGIKYGPDAGLMVERMAQAIVFNTADRIEGTSAFLEKRKPAFKGR